MFSRNKTTMPIMIMPAPKQSVSAMKKRLELRLVELIEDYQAQGLDVEWIGVDLSDGVDANVRLKITETTKTTNKTKTVPAYAAPPI